MRLATVFKLDCMRLNEEATEAGRILQERMEELAARLSTRQAEGLATREGEQDEMKYGVLHLTFVSHQQEGYSLEISEQDDVHLTNVQVTIRAGRTRDYIAGAGELLKRLLLASESGGLEKGSWEQIPKHPVRIHYMPGHFGNSFEISWSGEMHRYLEDMALAGASGYGDWFDPNDMPDPYNSHVFHSTSMFLWRRKKEWLSYSQRLGLDNILVVTPNIGFVDQMRPEWVGVRNHQLKVQGQVLCPSNAEARAVILQNHRNLFEDLHASGIQLSKFVCAPYDDGGCGCAQCQPYYPVFLELVQDVYEVASTYYKELRADICGWWTSDEEREQLKQFVQGPAKDWFSMFQFSATYGVFALPDVKAQFEGISLGSFLHIGFSNDNRDVYIKTGIHSAADRLQSVIRSFEAQECHGFMTYNESFGDHYNAFLTSQLGWNPDASVREMTAFYGRLILGLEGEALNKLVDVLLEMQYLNEERALHWKRALDSIRPHIHVHPVQPWAFEHIAMKAELMILDEQIDSQLALTDAVAPILPVMEQRLKLSEQLWRHNL